MPQFSIPARLLVMTEITVEATDEQDAISKFEKMEWVDSGLGPTADIADWSKTGTVKRCS